MTFKYKHIILSSLFLLLGLFVAPLSSSVYAAPTENSGGANPSPRTAPKQSNDVNCASNGTCADCSAANSSASGCIDCGIDGKACGDSAVTGNCDNDECDIVKKILNPIIVLLSGLVGLAVALSIIVGSIQYAASAGDPQKAAKGRDRIKNAIIALVAYLFFFAFLNFIIPGGLL